MSKYLKKISQHFFPLQLSSQRDYIVHLSRTPEQSVNSGTDCIGVVLNRDTYISAPEGPKQPKNLGPLYFQFCLQIHHYFDNENHKNNTFHCSFPYHLGYQAFSVCFPTIKPGHNHYYTSDPCKPANKMHFYITYKFKI